MKKLERLDGKLFESMIHLDGIKLKMRQPGHSREFHPYVPANWHGFFKEMALSHAHHFSIRQRWLINS
jgi:hypothetical protein